MKKLFKAGVVCGVVFILTGTCFTAATFAMGADPVQIAKYFARRFEFLDYGIAWDGGDAYPVSGENVVRPEDALVQAPDQAAERLQPEGQMPDGRSPEGQMPAGQLPDGQPQEEPLPEELLTESPQPDPDLRTFADVSEFKVKAKGGNVEVTVSEDVTAMEIVSVSGDMEHVEHAVSERNSGPYGETSKVTLRAAAGEEWNVTVPAGWVFNEFEAEADNGNILIYGINAVSAEYKAEGGSGNVYAEQPEGEGTAELDCEGGVVELRYTGSLPRFLSAECESGEIMITVPAEVGDDRIRCTAKCENGRILLPDGTEAGAGRTGFGPPEGAETDCVMELEAENGSITVVR